MSSAVAPSPTSESSSTSSNATPNSNQPHQKPGFPPPLMPSQLNDNYETNLAEAINASSFSMLDNKENKDDNNTINNNKNYSHIMNSNNSSTTTIVGSNSASTIKGSTISANNTGGGNIVDEAKRSCNRCQNCQGFSSHEWRNTCTSCRCPRSCHDISIGARCCGFHRAGFDPSSTGSSGQSAQLQKNNSVSTIPATSSNLPSHNQSTPSMQPPLPSGNAPAIESSNSSSTANTLKSNTTGLSCSRTAGAESAGYSWMPTVGSC